MKVAGTPPAPFWDLLVGTCVQSSALFDKSWAAAPHEIKGIAVPRLKLLVDGDFERSFKRKQASRGPSFASDFEVQWPLRAEQPPQADTRQVHTCRINV